MQKSANGIEHERDPALRDDSAPRTGLSRRRLLALLGTGGAAAAVSATALQQPNIPTAAAQADSGTPTPSAEALVTPAGERLHVKPIVDDYFISHGTSIEMQWRPEITNEFLMDSGQFFIRNHTASPIIDPATWQLRIDGPGVDNPLTIAYADLMAMPSVTVTRFVECAGNGRSLYDKVLDNPGQGTQWTTGGYGVGTWTGVPLSAILEQAGVNDSAVSIMASGLDESGFEKPLPIDKAMADDTLVVYEMNRAPLPYDHGFPARLLVPGWVGSYNVKWLGSLTVGDEQLYSKWNTSSYVLVGPEYEDPAGPPEGEIIREQTLKSVVALPWGAALEPGRQQISGYAWSPVAPIAKVEVSVDGGETWTAADLVPPNVAAGGVRWEYTLDAEPGEMTIMTRATDSQRNTQYPVDEQVWNQKGYVWGAIIPHPVTIANDAAVPAMTPTPTAPSGATVTPTPMPEPTATPMAGGGMMVAALAASGSEVYANTCAECHGPEGTGGTFAPAIIGPDADLSTYDTARGLYNYIRSSMPQDNPGSLTDQQYLQVLAYTLAEHGYVGDDQMLTFDNLAEIELD